MSNLEQATFGGGCFWCTEALFNEVKGVEQVVSGYAGGKLENPNYEQVSTGTTGYVEVVQITFDSEVVPYEILLSMFFAMHDPTSQNRQGNDVGPQYASVVFYHDQKQKGSVEKAIDKLQKEYAKPIVTILEPLKKFYTAEEYHQKFYEQNTSYPYCQFIISPKLKKFREEFTEFLK